MHTFKGFVIKEFRHILRDRRTLLILFGLPIAMLMIFGYAVRNEVNEAKIAILDHSDDAVTRSIIQKIDASSALSVSQYLQNTKQIDPALKGGDIKEVIIFEKNFKRKLERTGTAAVQLITDASEPNIAGLVQQYSQAIIQSWQPENQRAINTNAGIQANIQMLFNPQLKSVYFFVPGLIAVILMIISAMMTSVSIVREKETGTMEVLLVSPLKPYHIIIGKVLPYLVLSLLNIATILLLSTWIFGVPFRGSLLFFMCVSGLFILSALALGLFISTRTDDQRTAMQAALMGSMLPTIILSGFIFPISSMPMALQWLSNLVPAKWYLLIVRGVMLMGTGFNYLLIPIGILLLMTCALTLAGVLNFNDRLE